jgi:hypothetical protein
MITLRRSEERGHADHGWLDTHHTFSFADYHDPEHERFSVLRVLNEDRVAPGAGFPPHSHREMEIVTCILEGALRHQDSMGNGSVIRPGDVQRMSAGTGVVHSEHNASSSEPVHFLQIWILPAEQRLEPSYEQKNFPENERRGRLHLVASPDGRDGSVTIHQDAFLYVSTLSEGDSVRHGLASERRVYLHVIRGAVQLGGRQLAAGDGARIEGEGEGELVAHEAAEILLFDLP